VLGVLLWHVSGIVTGDGLFHLARVRKLVDLGNLHLRTVDEFKDGGLHPGYAFPLWHGLDALVAKIAGLDPGVVIQHEASLLAPLACVIVWEAGVAVFDSAAAGFAVLAAQLGIYCFAAGHGGSWTLFALPATGAKQLLVLFFGFLESRTWVLAFALAATFGELTLVHATYALFALIPLAAYAVVRLGEWRRSAIALGAACLPTLAALLWLRPLVDESLGHNPTPKALHAGLQKYALELQIWSDHRFRIEPALVSRTGAVAVAALVLVPIAGFAARRRWSALVLGGTVALLALLLVPTLFVHFSKLVSLSQSRRAAGFMPYPFAFAGGLAVLARSWLVAPAALAAGIVLEREWPGDFSYGLAGSGPRVVTWIAFIGGAAALVIGTVFFRRRTVRERHAVAAVAAALFVLPVAVHGFQHWSPEVTSDPHALSPALLRELKRVPQRAVIIASPQISYRLLAAAPVYVVAAPPVHVANTRANQPYVRVKEVEAWLAGRAPGVARRYGATWAVRQGRLYRLSG
jgi:4-amino-4-deoxy-L-arabinose transferase-like glycosyltransferase